MVFFHQKTDPEERETEQEHQGEDHPAAATDLARCVWRLVGAAVRTFELAGILVAHFTLLRLESPAEIKASYINVNIDQNVTVCCPRSCRLYVRQTLTFLPIRNNFPAVN